MHENRIHTLFGDSTIHHIHLQGFEEDHTGKSLHVVEFLQDTRHSKCGHNIPPVPLIHLLLPLKSREIQL